MRTRYDYDNVKEIQELVEEYRRNASNYGRRFHKTRLNGSYESSHDRVRSENLEEFSNDTFYMEDYIQDEFEE